MAIKVKFIETARAYWRLDDNSTSIAIDSSPNGRAGTIVSATVDTGFFGNGRRIGTAGSGTNITCNNMLTSNNNFTMSGWFKVDPTKIGPNIWGNYLSTIFGGSYIGLAIAVSTTKFYSINYFNGSGHFQEASTIPVVNEWVHLVLVKNASSVKLFVNGNLAKSLTLTYDSGLHYSTTYSGGYVEAQYTIDEIGVWGTSFTDVQVKELYDSYLFNTVYKQLVNVGGIYKKYANGAWETVTITSPTENDYLNGIDDISTVPETAWQQLDGTIEICSYTNDPEKTEIQINITTDPFTLSEEWKDKSVEVLCYTDDPSASQQNIDITMKVKGRKNLTKNISSPKILAYNSDPSHNINVNASGTLNDRYYKYKVSIDDTETPNNPDDVLINWTPWKTTNTDTSLTIPSGYVNKINPYNVKVDVLQFDNTTVSGSGQVILFNQAPTFVMGTISYNTLSVTIDDPDSDTIQCQILLNNKIVLPSDGGWSAPQTVPYPVVFKFDTKDILIGRTNTCVINVKDQFGTTSSLALTFQGDYSGIMFSDANGGYYSTDSGEVIKRLDFGIIIAGFNSDIAALRIINKNAFPIRNLILSLDKTKVSPYTDVKMSRYSGDGFLDSDTLIYDQLINSGEHLEFYVRIKTQQLASGGSLFKINAKADVSI